MVGGLALFNSRQGSQPSSKEELFFPFVCLYGFDSRGQGGEIFLVRFPIRVRLTGQWLAHWRASALLWAGMPGA